MPEKETDSNKKKLNLIIVTPPNSSVGRYSWNPRSHVTECHQL